MQDEKLNKRVAAVQMASGPNTAANLIEAQRLIALSAEAGASLVVLPENFSLMGHVELDRVKAAETDGQGQVQDFLAEQAAKHKIWLVGGTVPIKARDADKVRAACLVYDSDGQCISRYDKIHLFDVALMEAKESDKESYNESQTIESGDQVVVLDTPIGKLGLAICYDIRFPELFRLMLDQGAEIFALPSAFTAITGKAHWEVIVRARAIENLCYVVAAAQGGYHVNGRETHGDSMIVDPWGIILDRLPRGSGYVVADIDDDRMANIRRNFPTIEHRKC